MFQKKIATLLIGTAIIVIAMLLVQTQYLLLTLTTAWLLFAIAVGRYPNESH